MRVFTFTLLFIIKLFSHTLYTHNNMLSWLQCCSLFLWFRCVVTQGFALFPWPSRLWVMRVCINILSAYSLLHNHIQYFFIFPGSAIAHARLPCVLMCSGIVIAVPPPWFPFGVRGYIMRMCTRKQPRIIHYTVRVL